MIEISITDDLGVQWINIEGRIDGITSPEIEQQISSLILNGQRQIVANMEAVNYISSAGLRVFLVVQKQLKEVGGEIVLFRVSEIVSDVFSMSGFENLFRIATSKGEIESYLHGKEHASIKKNIEGITFSYVEKDVSRGDLVEFGSQDKLPFSQYTQNDVVSVRAKDICFGTGLASIGNSYEEYRHLFGEAVILNRNLFFYPAIKRPAVDFMFGSKEDTGPEYRFLHGFGFNGAYRYILLFESNDTFVELDRLVHALFQISDADILGIVILAESKGVWGMNLKKVPFIENRPENGKDIFDPENFPGWMNFPVAPADVNNVVAAAGIAVREKGAGKPSLGGLMTEKNNCHFHAGIFSKGPLSKEMDRFEDELGRVIKELEVSKVQHLLGKTCFSSGILGIVELEG